MLYKHHNQFVTLDDFHFQKVVEEEERRHRNGTLKYEPLALTSAQVDALKKEWPPDKLKELGAKAKDEAFADLPPLEKGYAALHSFLTKDMYPADTPACKFAALDLAFSMLVRQVPGLKFDGSVDFLEREVNGKKFRLRPSTRFAKMVVKEEKAKDADFYVFAVFSEALTRCWLLGWASKEDILSANRGNRKTNEELRWPHMSYYKSTSELRPMADLVRQMGIDSIPDGILFEAVPSVDSFPLSHGVTKHIELFMKTPELKEPTQIAGIDDAPQQQEEEVTTSDPDSDEYSF